MISKYPLLSSPLKVGNVTFRNRMCSAPMSGAEITADCCIGRSSRAFYELRAKGGAANITVSEVMVHPETDGSHAYHLNTTTPGSIPSFTLTADAIKRHGAIASVELSHSGQYAGTYMQDKSKKASICQWGPSDGVRPDGRPVKALTKEMMEDIVKSYGEVAGLAKRCGFEMVMVHGGHGWLLNQFLSPLFNHRTDEYGGSLENRVRFIQEVLVAVRKAVGPGFPIEFRLSGDEFYEGGYTLEDGVKIAQLLEPYIDIIHVSAGTYQKCFGRTHPSMFLPHGVNVYLAAEIKKHVSIPVATLGGLNDPAQMEDILASGQADLIYMGRALLADHELPKKVVGNRDEDIVRCLRCFTCMAERGMTSTRRCAVNPVIGREMDTVEIVPARKPKNVLIVGGGPAGLKAAETAALRGHKVTLCEKEPVFGGVLTGEQAIPFKHEMYQLGLTLAKAATDAGAVLKANTPVTREMIDAMSPDAVIVAAGSVPIIPPIPGISGENVIGVTEYYTCPEKVGRKVAVLGGGLAGCEMAVHLSREGKQVSLVEMRSELAPDANIRHRPILLQEIADQKIAVFTNYRGTEINEKGITCTTSEGDTVLIAADTVICAAGQKANTPMVDALRNSAPEVAIIGDCRKVANITEAVYQGYHAALDL